MNNVVCQILEDKVNIYRDGVYLGAAYWGQDHEPQLILHGGAVAPYTILTFNDLDIIMDNWHQMVGMIDASENL